MLSPAPSSLHNGPAQTLKFHFSHSNFQQNPQTNQPIKQTRIRLLSHSHWVKSGVPWNSCHSIVTVTEWAGEGKHMVSSHTVEFLGEATVKSLKCQEVCVNVLDIPLPSLCQERQVVTDFQKSAHTRLSEGGGEMGIPELFLALYQLCHLDGREEQKSNEETFLGVCCVPATRKEDQR